MTAVVMGQPRHKRTVGRVLRRVLLWALIALLALQAWYLGCIVWWSYVNPSSTRFMQIRLSELREKKPDATLQRQWVDYNRISPNIKRAVIAAEDGKFLEHNGVDWDAIEQAYQRNQRRGHVTHGGSTISQQLAKNLFLSSQRSYVRKGQEFVITLMLEGVWSKHRILEVYLNSVEWGNGVFGIEAAARHYFGTSAANLSPSQASQLAAMLPAPRFYDRNRGSGTLARRAATIEARMYQVAIPR